jgi:hypothetical protein
MRKSIAAACILAATMFGHASAQAPASNVIRKAAQALGGVDRVLSVRSLRIEGYGQEALQNGGGNASASADAPQRWNNIMSYEETIDLSNHRVRVRQRTQAWLPAATLSRVFGNIVTTSVLDGDVPYTVSAQGADLRANAGTGDGLRAAMLTHPVALVRMALDRSTVVDNLRTQGRLQIVDIHPRQGPRLTLAADRESGLPVWVIWMENDSMLRDLTFQTDVHP